MGSEITTKFEAPRRVMLDPGHGGSDQGASFRGICEKDVVLSICRVVQDNLQYKYWAGMTRNEDKFVHLSNRADLANMWKADIFVSVHCNADPDIDKPGMPEAKGEEIWIYEDSFEGRRLAEALRLPIDKAFPENPFRGIKSTKHLTVLKNTKMPAVLVELGFIDNEKTNVLLTDPDNIRRIGHLLVTGVMKYMKGYAN